MRDITVLLTATGGAGAPGIISSLRENGERRVRVVAVDTDPLAVGLHLADVGQTVPRADAPAYVDTLLDLCRSEGVDVVCPGISHELHRLSHERARFDRAGIRVAVPEPKTLARMDDKALLYATLERQGLPVAPWRLLDGPDQLTRAAHALGYPNRLVALKPRIGSGGRGFSVLDAAAAPDPDARDRAPFPRWTLEQAQVYYDARAASFAPMLAMAYLPGPEYSVDMLTDKGRTLYCLPRTREVVRLGTSTLARLVREPDVVELCQNMAACLEACGNVNIQVKRDGAGHLLPVEVNPRFSGTIVFCTRAGVNLPYFGVKYRLGEEIPLVEPRWGAVMIRHFTEVVLDARPGEGPA